LPKLFADETTVPVLDPCRGRTKTGQLWAYARDDRSWCGTGTPGVTYESIVGSLRHREVQLCEWLWSSLSVLDLLPFSFVTASASSIKRRIASEREVLSFCCTCDNSVRQIRNLILPEVWWSKMMMRMER
jgi:hypothetical protein